MEMAQPLLASDSTLGTFPTELVSCSPSVPRLCSCQRLFPHRCRTWCFSLLNSMRFLHAHLSSTATGSPACCHCKPESALCHLPQATARGDEQGRARPQSCRIHVSSNAQVQYHLLTTTLQGQLSNCFIPPPSCPPFQILMAKLRHEDTAGKKHQELC